MARTPADPLRIAVLVSGHGSNLQALIDDAQRADSPYQIALVISNNPAAFALQRAREAGLDCKVIHHRDHANRDDFERELVKACEDAKVELVVLAGFMRILGPVFLRAFQNQVINIHPALNPSFPGLNAQRQALESGVWFTGCTVHLVNEGVDTGAILAQAVVPVHDDDTEDTLSQRIHVKEHQLLKTVVRSMAEGCVAIDGRRIRALKKYKKQSIDKMLI